MAPAVSVPLSGYRQSKLHLAHKLTIILAPDPFLFFYYCARLQQKTFL
jgi:hypothetical protein